MPLQPSIESAEQIAGVVVLRDPQQFRQWCRDRRREGRTLGLVPTMGALHAGHLSLVDIAKQHAELAVVTIFVNPLQFGASEDLASYPRTLVSDCEQCAAAGVAAVFAPLPTAMYPQGFQTHVQVEQVSQLWCGASRPGHFRGVATVVAKLLNLAMADVAVFGEKDWQQLAVLRRMALDLDHPTQVLGAPIVRDADGLALSSRNVYLSADERRQALVLSQGLARLGQGAREGRDLRVLEAEFAQAIELAGGRVDYAAAVDADTLEPLQALNRPGRALVAAWFGGTRLLDNAAL
jgi:pantoate--beta-alanine ligase